MSDTALEQVEALINRIVRDMSQDDYISFLEDVDDLVTTRLDAAREERR